MRREKLVIIAVGSVFTLLLGCQQQAKIAEEPIAKESAVDKVGPKIEFESMVHDFGKVGPSQKLVGEFKFTNTGDETLKITKVEKCCGASTSLDKDKLAPGESGILEVHFTSSRMATKIMKHIYVNSNDKKTPRATLTFKVETVLLVDYEPQRLKLMLNEENAGCPDIILTSNENKAFSIKQFVATNDALTVEYDSSIVAKKFVLEPKADMEKLQSRSTGRLNITLAYPGPDEKSETIMIPFQALSQFSIRPSMLIVLFNEQQEGPAKKLLWITNNYDEEFEVVSTSVKEGNIKVLSQKKVGNRYQFELEITPPAGENVKKFSDTFTVNLKDGETLEVPCRGIYKAPKAQNEQ